MGFDQFFSILALILILILILPNFIKTNNNKQFFKNIFIWGIIVALVMIFSVFLFT